MADSKKPMKERTFRDLTSDLEKLRRELNKLKQPGGATPVKKARGGMVKKRYGGTVRKKK
jgi:hypothetical protein